MSILDRPSGYGPVTRILHWSMAVMILVQFAAAGAHYYDQTEAGIGAQLWSLHFSLGATILVLAVLRGIWGLINMKRRPKDPGFLGMVARAGHLALYILMIAVPALAVMRVIGAQRDLVVWGMTWVPAGDAKIQWMADMGNLVHGPLGWTFAALTVGHIGMAILHSLADGLTSVLPRMTSSQGTGAMVPAE